MLVEKYLYAVVSLPAGVFNPYSGVKTSILLMDKTISKRTDKILFAKIENDGFDLGAQRRSNTKGELPEIAKAIKDYIKCINNGIDFDTDLFSNLVVTTKEKISENEWNLSGERYKVQKANQTKVKTVTLDEIATIEYGYTTTAKESGNARFIRITDINERGELRKDEIKYIDLDKDSLKFILNREDVLVARTGATYGKTMIFNEDYKAVFASFLIRIKLDKQVILPSYYHSFAQTELYWEQAKSLVTGGGQPQFNGNALKQIRIPLPPLDVQKEIVAEIEGWQKIIDGARQVVENYKPQIQIDPAWEQKTIGELCELFTGGTPTSTNKEYYENGNINWLVSGDIHQEEIKKCHGKITELGMKNSNAKLLPINSVLIALNGQGKTRGTVALLRIEATCNQSLVAMNSNDKSVLLPEFLYYQLKSKYNEIRNLTGDDQRSGLNMPIIRQIKIGVPDIEIQNKFVDQFATEQKLVNSNKELITIFEQKIKNKIASIWGE
jgi:type I restriction enzyme M protein